MNENGFTLIEIILVVALLLIVGTVFTSQAVTYMEHSREGIDRTSAINIVKELKLLSMQDKNLLSGNTRELTIEEVGYAFPKPRLTGKKSFFLKFINADEDKVEIRYDNDSGRLIYEEIIRAE